MSRASRACRTRSRADSQFHGAWYLSSMPKKEDLNGVGVRLVFAAIDELQGLAQIFRLVAVLEAPVPRGSSGKPIAVTRRRPGRSRFPARGLAGRRCRRSSSAPSAAPWRRQVLQLLTRGCRVPEPLQCEAVGRRGCRAPERLQRDPIGGPQRGCGPRRGRRRRGKLRLQI